MNIYVDTAVTTKEDEYVDFLIKSCDYLPDEAEIRRWEIEHQIKRKCNPILTKPNTSGTFTFKSVLQRQEIRRFKSSIAYLESLIKRRNGGNGNTQWKVDYYVTTNGDVYITSIVCYNMFSESIINQIIMESIGDGLNEERLRKIIKRYVRQALGEALNEKTLLEHRSIGRRRPNRVRNL